MLVISVPYNIVWEESSFSFPGYHEANICRRTQEIIKIVWLWADVCDLIVCVQIVACDDQQNSKKMGKISWCPVPELIIIRMSALVSICMCWTTEQTKNRQTLVMSVSRTLNTEMTKVFPAALHTTQTEHSPLTFTYIHINICCSCAVNHSSSCSPGWDSHAQIT